MEYVIFIVEKIILEWNDLWWLYLNWCELKSLMEFLMFKSFIIYLLCSIHLKLLEFPEKNYTTLQIVVNIDAFKLKFKMHFKEYKYMPNSFIGKKKSVNPHSQVCALNGSFHVAVHRKKEGIVSYGIIFPISSGWGIAKRLYSSHFPEEVGL